MVTILICCCSGAWTRRPTEWTNDYFQNLLNNDWVTHKGPGGKYQWMPSTQYNGSDSHSGTVSNSSLAPIMMLTTDIGLLHDPIYLDLVSTQ